MKNKVIAILLALVMIVPVGTIQAEKSSSNPGYIKTQHSFIKADTEETQEDLDELLNSLGVIVAIDGEVADDFQLIELGAVQEDRMGDLHRFDAEDIKELIEGIPSQYLEPFMDQDGKYFAIPNLYAAQTEIHINGMNLDEFTAEALDEYKFDFQLDVLMEELALAMLPKDKEVTREMVKEHVEILESKLDGWKLSDSADDGINYDQGIAVGRVFINGSRLHDTALAFSEDLESNKISEVLETLISLQEFVSEETLIYLPEEDNEDIGKTELEELQAAQDVLGGLYGDGLDRNEALMVDGFDPVKVQSKVNLILEGKIDPPLSSTAGIISPSIVEPSAGSEAPMHSEPASIKPELPIPITTTSSLAIYHSELIETTQISTSLPSTSTTEVLTDPPAPKTLQEIKLEYIGWDDPTVFMFWSLAEASDFGAAKQQEGYDEANAYNLLPGIEKQDYAWTNFMDVNGYTGWEAHTIQQGIAVLTFY